MISDNLPTELPPWLVIAYDELGTEETGGSKATPQIIEYHKATTLRATSDEVPWCSSFVNWVMHQAGYPTTRSAAARSWSRYGVASELRKGAIIVVSRGTNPAFGHVGFVWRSEGPYVWILGGNQGNRVSIARYPLSRLVAVRWPKERERPIA